MIIIPLFSADYLKSLWSEDFQKYLDSGTDNTLREKFIAWDKRDKSQSETQSEQGLINRFFVETWDYWESSARPGVLDYNLFPKFKIKNAGQGGGTGEADLALGNFKEKATSQIPQVLCEFKDIKSSLDAPQNRRGNNRSPVKQCFDYLKHAFDDTDTNSVVFPSWGLTTDMNEFRLYSRRVGMGSYQQFFIRKPQGWKGSSLTEEGNVAAFQRYIFQRLFHRKMLLTEYGKSDLEKTLEAQRIQENNLEKSFYIEYQAYREFVFSSILEANKDTFEGTPGHLVQLTQRFLDRCIFILFCEDMGSSLRFPTNLLRDVLVDQSRQAFYSPDHDNIWSLVKQLFESMRDGGYFPPEHTIPHFNGGLFAALPELEQLKIPNRVFCLKGQGESSQAILAEKKTLLYLSANYNFGTSGDANERTITLYALGRIFEQSITDLEYMEAEAEGRKTFIAKLNKRKRNGVYYTPEWVTEYIVRETIGARLADARSEIGLELGRSFSEKAQQQYLKYLNSSQKNKKPPKNEVTRHIAQLVEYRSFVEGLKVLDPACGSGAFLIQALNYLLSVRNQIATEMQRVTQSVENIGSTRKIEKKILLIDLEENVRDILSKSLYGVDLNPESVEITQLAMWLNTAVPGKPLSNLDKHIRSGNSLVGPDFIDFYNENFREQSSLFDDLPEAQKEKVNVFDWVKAFPEVFGETVPNDKRGFDCVIGNPPYVKLQNFRKVKPEEAEYYSSQRITGNSALYESAQTGNFDLYLLFIEKGIHLLNECGRLGYIAPNVWLKNEYGEGLRQFIKRHAFMDRWVDFAGFQVFDEATTYTSLQFYSKKPNAKVRFELTPNGEIIPIDWDRAENIEIGALPETGTWNFMPKIEQVFLDKLYRDHAALEELSNQIFQGLITGADVYYHLERIGNDLYKQVGTKADGKEYKIEDDIMHPLVSGPEAKRYQRPVIEKHILFPYTIEPSGARLYTDDEMQRLFPNAWSYLKLYEDKLRKRENGAMDHDGSWWAFGRNQSLNNQENSKLCVAQTVKKLEIFFDSDGEFYINNVRVNGILVDSEDTGWFLLGVLNTPTPDFVFRRISIPKANGYFEANKQYIAPLPIPKANEEQRKQIGAWAKELQTLTTERRDLVALIQFRLDGPHCVSEQKDENWIWADIKSIQRWKDEAPEDMPAREKTSWAKEQRETKLEKELQKVDALLKPGAVFIVNNEKGYISFMVNGQIVISAFVPIDEGAFLEVQWRQIARTTNVTEKFQAKTLVKHLLNVRSSENQAFIDNTIELDKQIRDFDFKLADIETRLNSFVYELYGLSADEIAMVEAG